MPPSVDEAEQVSQARVAPRARRVMRGGERRQRYVVTDDRHMAAGITLDVAGGQPVVQPDACTLTLVSRTMRTRVIAVSDDTLGCFGESHWHSRRRRDPHDSGWRASCGLLAPRHAASECVTGHTIGPRSDDVKSVTPSPTPVLGEGARCRRSRELAQGWKRSEGRRGDARSRPALPTVDGSTSRTERPALPLRDVLAQRFLNHADSEALPPHLRRGAGT